jgi:hypothetical protein
MNDLKGSVNGGRSAERPTAGRPDPVFVLCMGRSGSTLLRFLLDAHPDLVLLENRILA